MSAPLRAILLACGLLFSLHPQAFAEDTVGGPLEVASEAVDPIQHAEGQAKSDATDVQAPGAIHAGKLHPQPPARMLKGILQTILAIALFLFFVALVRLAGKILKFKLTRYVVQKLPKIPSGRHSMFKSVSTWLGVLINAMVFIIAAAAFYVCATYVLSCFAYTHPWSVKLEEELKLSLLKIGKTVLDSLPGLFTVAVIGFLTKGLTHLVTIIFDSVERGEATFPGIYQDTAAPTRRIVVAVLWIFAIVVAYPYIPGNESIAFKSISVFMGLLVSLGSAGVVSQAMNGLAITFGRSFKPGDYVRIGAVEGTVSEVTLVFTKLHTIRHEEIIIPNSVVASQATYNYTRMVSERGVGISAAVTMGYDVPWRQVHAILMMAAEMTNGLSKEAPPYIIQTAFSNTFTEYTLVVHMTAEPKLVPFVKSELYQNIQDEFNRHGVSLMLPNYIETHVPGSVPEERWCPPPATKDGR